MTDESQGRELPVRASTGETARLRRENSWWRTLDFTRAEFLCEKEMELRLLVKELFIA